MAYPPEVWQAIRKEYESGALTVTQLSRVQGNPPERSIYTKAAFQKWKKPSADQIVKIAEIAEIAEKQRLTKQEALRKIYNEMVDSFDVMMLRASFSDFFKVCDRIPDDPEPDEEDFGSVTVQLLMTQDEEFQKADKEYQKARLEARLRAEALVASAGIIE